MPAATDRIEFTPPPQPGRWRALALALLAHVVLMIALTWGITWNNQPQDMSAQAELWASVPQQAAPREVTPPAPPVVQAPPLQATPLPAPAPEPAPEPKVQPPAPPKEPDIALQEEKRKQQLAERRRLEQERQKLEARQRQEEQERERKLEARKRQEDAARQKKLEARREQEEAAKREVAERKAAAEKKRHEEEAKAAKARQQEDTKRGEARRQENLRRMQGMANATGDEGSSGKAARAEGPSSSYAGRIRSRVRPNIVFTDDISGNPTAEVEVRMAPDGTIVSKRVSKSSGVRSWDEAVIRALDKTEVLPRDVDGRVHSPLIIAFRLRD